MMRYPASVPCSGKVRKGCLYFFMFSFRCLFMFVQCKWHVLKLKLYDSKHVDVWIEKSDQGGNGRHLSHVWSWYRNKLDPDWGRYVFCLRLYTSQEFLFRPWLHTKTSKKKSDWETAVNFKTLKSCIEARKRQAETKSLQTCHIKMWTPTNSANQAEVSMTAET